MIPLSITEQERQLLLAMLKTVTIQGAVADLLVGVRQKLLAAAQEPEGA